MKIRTGETPIPLFYTLLKLILMRYSSVLFYPYHPKAGEWGFHFLGVWGEGTYPYLNEY